MGRSWWSWAWLLCAGPLLAQEGSAGPDSLDLGRMSRISASFFIAPLSIRESTDPDARFDVELQTGIGGGLTYTLFSGPERRQPLMGVGLGAILNTRDGAFYDVMPALMLTVLRNRVGIGYGYNTGREKPGLNRHRVLLSLGINLQ